MSDLNVHTVKRFHWTHGSNVILYDDNTVAYRKASFADAVTLSDKPLLPGEIFLVEIEKTEPGWTGHMRLGLTQVNPWKTKNSELASYSLPDFVNLGNSWICAITKSHNRIPENSPSSATNVVHSDSPSTEDSDHHRSSEKSANADHRFDCGTLLSVLDRNSSGICRSNLNSFSSLLPSYIASTMCNGVTCHKDILPTDEGSRIGVVYIPKGDFAEMHYIINGEDQGVFTKKLPYREAPLYVIVDVYGTTKQVRIIQLCPGVPALKKMCRTIILRHIALHGVDFLPLPPILKEYLLYET